MTSEPSIQLGNRTVAADRPCYVIAEVGVNHNGDIDLAHKMIDAAAAAGVDAVKFQTYRTDDLVLSSAPKASYQQDKTGGGSQSDMLRALELTGDDFHALRRHCADAGIDFMSTAFDPHSLETVIGLDPICLKWPSGELNNTGLLRQAARSGLPILLSTGMGSLTEIAAALDLLTTEGCDDVVVLQCVSNYPARIEDQNLRCMPAMSRVFGRPVGFSDHTVGPYAAVAARALGMAVLEKHFTLDRTMEGPDHSASSEPADFAHLVQILRAIETGLGDGVKRPNAAEANVQAVARKSLVFRRNLKAGHVLDEADLTAKRPGTGIAPNRIDLFLGSPLTCDVAVDDMLSMDHIR
ncbi:N-acetylneuraminate synthase (plasmid) [Pseudohalocynthiibacter aestuariivivens]|uniref:N-acetylneuraminate synthase family protein n=1 Tax=Roseovarius pelagicus TaxID=2980108 RepID=A0ABY6D6C1_9RHOB|nr:MULTISPECIES: N-acetylneuraminate synthase family protein [Rhodobacterales]QIE47915.1 N-acetylneuraminate synthase [Pseudohalocynthiibacter aestuariivivens]UXX81409.1 N-acetylneuraminate synthase family protein [Roseovarius pelagicus]